MRLGGLLCTSFSASATTLTDLSSARTWLKLDRVRYMHARHINVSLSSEAPLFTDSPPRDR